MKLYKIIICITATALWSANLCAQELALETKIKISGIVQNKHTGKGVPKALVIVTNAKHSTRTENDGAFSIQDIVPQPLNMVVSCKGFKTQRHKVEEDKLKDRITINLEPASEPNLEATVEEPEPEPGTAMGNAPPKKRPLDVSGVISDAKNGSGIVNARVTVDGTNLETNSDPEGTFSLKNLTSETAVLTVSAQGYETRTVQLTSNQIRNGLQVAMTPSTTYELESMDVQAEKVDVPQLMKTSENVSVVDVSPDLIVKLPNMGEADIFRTLQLMPGISGTNENSAGLYVRGGSPDQNLILLDGMPIYYVDHFFGFFSAFNASAIENVKLHKGAFGARYGGRLSSVVELSSKTSQGIHPTDGNGVVVGGGVSMLASNLAVKVPILDKEKGSLFIAARRSFTDFFRPVWFENILDANTEEDGQQGPGGGFQQQTRPEIDAQPVFYFYDLNGIATFAPNEKNLISGSFYRSSDDLDASIDTTYSWIRQRRDRNTSEFAYDTITSVTDRDDESVWGNFAGGSLHWRGIWSDAYATNVNLAYTNFKEDDIYADRSIFNTAQTQQNQGGTQRGGQQQGDQWTVNRIVDLTFSLSNTYQLNDANTIEAGFQATQNNIKFEDYNSRRTDQINEANDTGQILAVYLEDELRLFDKLFITPGLRLNYFAGTDGYYLDPRVNFRYKIGKYFNLKGAWGIYSQFVNRVLREDILNGSNYYWMLADNSNVPVAVSNQFVAGLSFETPMFLVDVEGYYKNMDGLVQISERQSNRRFVQLEASNLSIFEGTGVAQGLELLLQKKIGNYTGWLAYTLSRTEHEFADLDFGEAFPALHDHTHEIKFINSYTLGNIDFSGVWIYATGQPYSTPLGSYQIALLDGRTTEPVYHVSKINEYRLPNYHRLDISAAYDIKLGRGNILLGAGVFNAYNNLNIVERTFSQTDDQFVEINTKSVGITPNLFLRTNFAF